SLMPWIGASQNSHEIDRVAYELETLTSLTLEGFQIMQPEMRAIRIMVMQNRMVLDMLLAEQGGVCHMVGEHCCTYIPE
ncbi:SYCY1 protein, partial [Polyodon spathula]|nr:SYCY1 protein [Polyodon spathula]